MLFQDDFGVEDGGQNGGQHRENSSLGAFQDGCRAMPFSEALGSVLDTPGTSKMVLPPRRRQHFWRSFSEIRNTSHAKTPVLPPWRNGCSFGSGVSLGGRLQRTTEKTAPSALLGLEMVQNGVPKNTKRDAKFHQHFERELVKFVFSLGRCCEFNVFDHR